MSIGFDDNWASQYRYGIPYLDRFCYPATVYSIVELVGQTGRQSLDQLKCLEEYSGGEVAAHSWTNATHTAGFTGVTTDVLDTELRLMKEWLIDNGSRVATCRPTRWATSTALSWTKRRSTTNFRDSSLTECGGPLAPQRVGRATYRRRGSPNGPLGQR